jgi:hypothetical protein
VLHHRLAAIALVLTLPLALVSVGCGDAPVKPPGGPSPQPVRVLFVGNSLTQVNDLPAMVEALSRAAGDDPPLDAGSVAFGGFALEDHLAEGSAARAIAEGGWDVVVLQQGPSALPASRENLIEFSGRFATLIRAAGARPALYGVWPSQDRIFDLDACIESYRLAAVAVDGTSLPAGAAWKAAWARAPALPLYGTDGFHPSALGTYLAALVIYSRLMNRSPIGLPGELDVAGSRLSIPQDQRAVVQAAAAAVIEAGATAP